MFDLNKLEDEELIFFIKLQSEEALNCLLERYKGKSRYIANELLTEFPNSGVNLETLTYVGLNAVNNAINKFEEGKETFFSFWFIIAKREMTNYLKVNSYTGKSATFVGISLDSLVDEDDERSGLTANYLSDNDTEVSQSKIFDDLILYVQKDKETFIEKEKPIVIAFLKGYEKEEIMAAFKISKSNYYRIIAKGKEFILTYFQKR